MSVMYRSYRQGKIPVALVQWYRRFEISGIGNSNDKEAGYNKASGISSQG
jgi:hypothetical protein